MNLKRLVGILALLFLVFWVITSPTSAADTLKNIGDILAMAANSIVEFFTQLI